MSQEQNEQTRRARRIARAQRNRPILVTNNNNSTGVGLDDSKQSAISTAAEPSTSETTGSEVETARETTTSRRPGFFSTIGKSDTETAPKEGDVIQARIARAIRGRLGKTATPTQTKPESTKAEEKKPASTSSRPAARPNTFKTRYIIGMALYLLAANFLGAYEVQFMRNIHADSVLTTFNLFGGKVVVSTSTLVFLATLIIILVLLARLDLIPRSLTGAAGSRPGTTDQKQTAQSGEFAPRYTPPAVRQGVKGSDDELYQAYRANQRRDKKK